MLIARNSEKFFYHHVTQAQIKSVFDSRREARLTRLENIRDGIVDQNITPELQQEQIDAGVALKNPRTFKAAVARIESEERAQQKTNENVAIRHTSFENKKINGDNRGEVYLGILTTNAEFVNELRGVHAFDQTTPENGIAPFIENSPNSTSEIKMPMPDKKTYPIINDIKDIATAFGIMGLFVGEMILLPTVVSAYTHMRQTRSAGKYILDSEATGYALIGAIKGFFYYGALLYISSSVLDQIAHDFTDRLYTSNGTTLLCCLYVGLILGDALGLMAILGLQTKYVATGKE